jgi:aminoglycoside/choline kinase family phosphotransferase
LNKKKINKDILLNDFEILSVLRNMKIIGIFTRLAVRDKKKQYLKLIPHAWRLIELRIKNNEIFNNFKKLLDLNFSKELRKLK